MKKITMMFLLSSSLFAFIRAPFARADRRAPLRGAVVTEGPSVRAVVRGPVLLRAYAGFAGGRIFTAPVISGTDADCALSTVGARAAAATPVERERALTVNVPAGQVACLTTSTERSFELLYRAYAGPESAAAQIASR